MKIAELMTRDLWTCRQHEMLDHAARLMWDHDIGALPVIDDFGQLVGMVTDRDVCMAAFMQRQLMQCVPISVAMTKHVVACRPEDTDEDAAKLMARHKIRRVPVVDDDQRPVGMVSLDDLALAMARGRDVTAAEVARTLAAICSPRRPETPAPTPTVAA